MTFLEYLTDYMQRLSYNETTDIAVLAHEAQSNNHRLQEPLFLYALFSKQTEKLLSYTMDAKMKQEYEELLRHYDVNSMELALQKQDCNLKERYTRVWHSYLVKANKQNRENRVKGLMRDKINQLQAQYGFTTDWLCKQLNFDTSVLTTWLCDGDNSQVSMDVARITWNYVEETMCISQSQT